MAESGRPPQARALLQQCLHARLQVRPAEGDAAAQWVEVMSAPQLRLSCGVQGRFLPRCLGDLCPRVSLRAGRLEPGTCCGRGGTHGWSAQRCLQFLPGVASLLSPAPPAPAPSPSDLFSQRKRVSPAWHSGNWELPLTVCLPELGGL